MTLTAESEAYLRDLFPLLGVSSPSYAAARIRFAAIEAAARAPIAAPELVIPEGMALITERFMVPQDRQRELLDGCANLVLRLGGALIGGETALATSGPDPWAFGEHKFVPVAMVCSHCGKSARAILHDLVIEPPIEPDR